MSIQGLCSFSIGILVRFLLSITYLFGNLEVSDIAIRVNYASTKSNGNFGNLACSKHALYPEVGMKTHETGGQLLV